MDNRKPRLNSAGFTLLELLLALGIVAVLAGIAIPAYRTHLERSYRSEAIAHLYDIASRQEGYFLQHNRYSEELAPLGFNPAAGNNGPYRIDISLTDPAGFILHAVPDDSQAADSLCGTLTLDNNGTRGAAGQEGLDAIVKQCWR